MIEDLTEDELEDFQDFCEELGTDTDDEDAYALYLMETNGL